MFYATLNKPHYGPRKKYSRRKDDDTFPGCAYTEEEQDWLRFVSAYRTKCGGTLLMDSPRTVLRIAYAAGYRK